MSVQAQAILEQALRLSADERAHLADELQRSLEDGASGLPPDEVARLWNEEIKRVYGGDLEKVDLLVGLMGEPLPEGFGFSDTAFRVFILMASRRLKSDRFLSKDYTPAMYTQPGIEWVEETSMLDVLRRHVPALTPALVGVENAFKPWRKVG